jgi:predicted metalloendopeptidase
VVAADFDFYGKALSGTPENRPRWKRVLASSNAALGEAIGKLYVDAVFPPEAKTSAKEMVDDVLKALEVRISNVDWMTAETKVKAIEKLHAVTVKIGYPDKWKNYSALEVKRNSEDASYAANFMAAAIWGHNEEMAKLHEPVDQMEWHMNPQTVNAYYNPLANEMVFPAAILQPPFFDFEADPAVNFGGIGCVIGHEISHGFDDQGSQFDKDGNFNNWWTEEDLVAFTDRGKSLVNQYSGYEPIDSLFINGQLTLGENIGDLGGVNASFDGLQIYLATHEVPEFIDGYTQDERFFMSWATIWRTKFRDEELRKRILTDPHSPGNYRAFAPLRNVDAFYTTFSVQEGDGMYLPVEERVVIW